MFNFDVVRDTEKGFLSLQNYQTNIEILLSS